MNHLMKRSQLFCLLIPAIVLMAGSGGTAQTITTSLVGNSKCPGEITIPVRVTNCFHIGSISLTFSYNPAILTFTGYQNLHPQLSSGFHSVNAWNGKVYIAWASGTPANIAADTLIRIKFTGITGSSSLNWDTQIPGNCEYSDSTSTIVLSTYTNATATVYQPPQINTQPANASVTAGQNTGFSVGAAGTGLTYQWQLSVNGGSSWNNLTNGGNYANVTSSTLSVNATTLSLSGNAYRCVVSGQCPSPVTSNPGTLTVNPVPQVLATYCGSASVCPGNVVIPLRVTNFSNIGSFSLTLDFNAAVLTFLAIQNLNPALSAGNFQANASNGKLYLTWANTSGATLSGNDTLVKLVFSGSSGSSSLNWDTQTPGNCEYAAPSGLILSSTYSNGNASFYVPPSITTQPADKIVTQGTSTSFSVGACGTSLAYQWQLSTNGGTAWSNLSNVAPYSGATSATLSISSTPVTLSGNRYRCIVSGLCPSTVTSGSALLTVNPPPQVISAWLGSKTICPGTVTIPLYATNFNNVGGCSFTISYNSSIMTYSNATCAIPGGYFQANAANGKVYITWAHDTPVSMGNDTLFRISFSGTNGSSALNWDLTTPGACEIVNGSGTAITTNYSNGSAGFYQSPVITSHPADKSVTEPQIASFSVGASAQGITYQWKISTNGGASWANITNNATYSGATAATLNVSGTTPAMSGHLFRCAVSGSCPSPVTSNPAMLTVTAAPQVITIRAGNASSVCAGLIRQPIIAGNFNGVASFSLVLRYDTNTLRFIGHENLHNSLSGGTFMVNSYKGKIYMVWARSSSASPGNDTLYRLKFDCSGGSTTNQWDTQVPGNCEITDANGFSIQTTYTNGTVTVSPTCNFTDLPSSHWAYQEIQYLCGRGIVGGSNCMVYPDDDLKRSQLAKVAFLGLFGSSVSVVSDAFPSPFNDLQNTGTYYYKYAKALSYLEYYDGVAPFDRNRFNFNPEEEIVRVHTLKVLLETFDIPPDESGPSPFTDIGPGDAFYGYVKAGVEHGIVSTTATLFRPWTSCTRAEAFVWLERIIHSNPLIPQPVVVNNLNPLTSSFFIPGNYTPYNFSSMVGLEQGNFNHYTKTSFAIPGKGLPLNFEHSYNSFLTELPDEFLPMNPLGAGWSHTWNAYLINTSEVRDNYDQVIGKPCLILFWPDGTMNVFDNSGAPTNPAPITIGVYDQLTRISSSVYTIKTKSQITYTFTKVSGSGSKAPYVLTAIRDRNNNTTQVSYIIGVDSIPRISWVKDAVNRQLNFSYQSGTNYIASITDPISRQIQFTVSNNQLASFRDAKNQLTTYQYDTATVGTNLLTTIILPKGNRIENEYVQHKLIRSRLNNNQPTQISRTSNYASGINDFVKSTVTVPQTNGQSVVTQYEFNRNGSATRVYGNPAANFTNQFTNSQNPMLPMAITNNNNGVTVNNTYDNSGNITHIAISASGMTTTHEYFEYNTTHDVVKHTDVRGNVTQYQYDANGNMVKVTNALGKETTMAYNGAGQMTSITNPNGLVTGFGYSSSTGMQNSITVPALSLISTMQYDLASRLKSVTDFRGNTTHYDYDHNDNLVQEKNALNHITGYAYDPNDNLLSVTNAKGGVTSMTYDTATDQLLSESFQGHTRYYTYNYDGSVANITDPNGNLFQHTYDLAGRLTGDGYATYAYLGNGNLQSISKAGKPIAFSYDAFNRVTGTTYDGFSVGYQYDLAGNITRITYPGGKQVNYTYDALNRMKTVADWNNQVTTYNYRDDGLLLSTRLPNGVTTTYTYDAAGRQTGLSTKRANGTTIAEYTYQLDNVGNHLREDLLQPLIHYPAVTKPVISYTYNNGNRILTADTIGFGYDFNGNTTSKTGYNFGWDSRNNLTSVTGRFQANYSYDGAGLRREASYDGNVKRFVLDVLGLSKVLMETNAAGTPQNYYVYGLGLISRIKPDNTTGYYVYDFRGSTVAMTNGTTSATVTHQYSYDDFGTITKSVETDFNPFRYVGQYGVMYEDSALVFMRARYYDNTIGRFLSEDPVWGVNLYSYGGNNPAVMIDPNGKEYTKAQYCKILAILAAEKKYGTQLTAFKASNTFFIQKIFRKKLQLGEDFNNVPIATSLGDIDLDWFTDLSATQTINWKDLKISTYVVGKTIWNLAPGKVSRAPLDDPGEGIALHAFIKNYKYSDLFTEKVLRENKPKNDNCSCP